MSTDHGSEERNLGGCSGCDSECYLGAPGPDCARDCEGRAGKAREEIGRGKDFDAVFLGEISWWGDIVTCRIRPRHQYPSVKQDNGFVVIQPCDGRVGHDGHALVDGFGWVVEDGVEVGGRGQTEACHAVLCAIEH